ncbi:MAG: protein kinase [Oscillospiraceae bacterium]|jgi:serine/threonine protein kinase|nr:protein kinase [Oscillospiraceae bacterium]
MNFKKFIALICTFSFVFSNLINVSADPTKYDIDKAKRLLKKCGYTVVQLLGSGSSSLVFKCRKSDDQLVAVKITYNIDNPIRKFNEVSGAQAVEAIKPLPESSLIRTKYAKYYYKYLNAPTVETFSAAGDVHYAIETPLADTDGWKSIIEVRDGTIPYQIFRKIIKAVLKALLVMHLMGIVHRDIKPENILIKTNTDRSVSYSLTDFGFSGKFCPEARKGSPAYAAPELFQRKKPLVAEQIFRTDTYSLGATICQMYLVRKGNLDAASPENLPKTILELQNFNTTFLGAPEGDLVDFIQWCTNPDPSQRPTAWAALSHQFLKKPLNSDLT